MSLVIDPAGLFKGRRLRSCSDSARLHWPYFLLASNGYGRIELDYEVLSSRLFVGFEECIDERQFWAVIGEYLDAGLCVVWQHEGGSFWLQWDTPEKLLPRYKTSSDKLSPEPGKPFRKSSELFRKVSEGEISESLRDLSENLQTVEPKGETQEFPKSCEKFPRSVAVAEESVGRLEEIPPPQTPPPEPETTGTDSGMIQSQTDRPTDPDPPPAGGSLVEFPTPYRPTEADISRFREFCESQTGSADLAFAAETLALVTRPATLEQIMALCVEKARGREVRSNGYFRSIVKEHFGPTGTELRERSEAAKAELAASRKLRAEYAAELRRLLDASDMAGHAELMRMGFDRWASPLEPVAAVARRLESRFDGDAA